MSEKLTEIERDQRNSNPHKGARCAMIIFHEKYIRQEGGSMDFWHQLSQNEKKTCREIVKEIIRARNE